MAICWTLLLTRFLWTLFTHIWDHFQLTFTIIICAEQYLRQYFQKQKWDSTTRRPYAYIKNWCRAHVLQGCALRFIWLRINFLNVQIVTLMSICNEYIQRIHLMRGLKAKRQLNLTRYILKGYTLRSVQLTHTRCTFNSPIIKRSECCSFITPNSPDFYFVRVISWSGSLITCTNCLKCYLGNAFITRRFCE